MVWDEDNPSEQCAIQLVLVYKQMYLCTYVTFGIDGIVYVYWFENLGYGEYNIFFKTVDKHQEVNKDERIDKNAQ